MSPAVVLTQVDPAAKNKNLKTEAGRFAQRMDGAESIMVRVRTKHHDSGFQPPYQTQARPSVATVAILS